MQRGLIFILCGMLLPACCIHALAQETLSPAKRLELTLVDNKSTYDINAEVNRYVNTLRLDQPTGPFLLTADMLNQGDNIITITRLDDKGGSTEVARVNLNAVFNASTVTITPTVSYYRDNAWSTPEPIGNSQSYQSSDTINLSSILLDDDFTESTASNTHPNHYEYSARFDANTILPDPSIPVLLTPDSDINLGAETSIQVLVSGYYLTQAATLVTSGPFAVYPTTLTADEVNNGCMVTVTFTGSGHVGTGELSITSGTATRTVNISHRSAQPAIIASPATVNISGGATSGTFTVSGTDLEGAITVTGDANFTVSPTSISMEDAMTGNVTVTVTPNGSITSLTNGTITLTSPDAEPVTVQVTYDPPFYASIDFNKCTISDPTSAEIVGYNGWTLVNVKIYQPGNMCAYLNSGTSFTYTMPGTFTGNTVYVTVTSDTGSDGAGSLLVNNVSHNFTSGSSYTWTVSVSANGNITFAAPSNTNWSCDIAKIVISAQNPAMMNAPRVSSKKAGQDDKPTDLGGIMPILQQR